MGQSSRFWCALLLAAGCTAPSPLLTHGDGTDGQYLTFNEGPQVPLGLDRAPSPSVPSSVQATPGATPIRSPSPQPAQSSAPSVGGADRYEAPIGAQAGGELRGWVDVGGGEWRNHAGWNVAGGLWQLPDFDGGQWAFRRYAGDAFGDDGRMPLLYQYTVQVRPKAGSGQIVIVPYFLDATHYEAVVLNLSDKNVSLIEYRGGTPTSGAQGTYDLSQNHRGWRPLPAADDDGSYSVRVRVNGQWHSLAVWIGQTWIDTPYVPAVSDQPHWVAIRSNGTPQEVLAVDIKRYTDPYLAR